MIHFTCPGCKARYKSAPTKAGTEVECLRCRTLLMIPFENGVGVKVEAYKAPEQPEPDDDSTAFLPSTPSWMRPPQATHPEPPPGLVGFAFLLEIALGFFVGVVKSGAVVPRPAFVLAALAFTVVMVILNFLIVLYALRDARSRGIQGVEIVGLFILVWSFGSIAWWIWKAARPQGGLTPCPKCYNYRLVHSRICPHCAHAA